jgi:selenocysteine-specific elongation factor
VGRAGRDAIDLAAGSVAAILRLAGPIAVAPGDRFVLRRTSGDDRIVGGIVLDTAPPRGISRRRQGIERVAELSRAIDDADWPAALRARRELHGGIVTANGEVQLATDVEGRLEDVVLDALVSGGNGDLPAVRAAAARSLRRQVTLDRSAALRAAASAVDRLVADGRLIREGGSVALPGSKLGAAVDPALSAAMDRLERALAVWAPPSLAAVARDVGCSSAGVRELERAGRIVLLEPDLAYATATYRELAVRALALAAAAPLTPGALRDATATSRRYVMAILEDLDRRGILRRTDAGHVPGPRAASAPGIGR